MLLVDDEREGGDREERCLGTGMGGGGVERRGRKGGEEGGGREGDRDMKEGGEGDKVG